MQSNSRELIKEAISKMPIGEVYDTVEIVLKFTGARSPKEVKEQLNSRFCNTSKVKVNAIPLADWCKDNNKNRVAMFDYLSDTGYLHANNSLTDEGFGDLHDIEPSDEIAMSNMVMFNTVNTANGYTVMINPSSPKYQRFLDIIAGVRGSYVGSKGFNAKKVCRAMRHLCPSYKIVPN